MVPLPIDPLLPRITAALEKHPNLILQASPGSGKTTRVPPALLSASWLQSDREILVLVPRRLAAKLAAYRVAEERREEVGATVGYQFRFERAIGPKTRLKFLTEGMLLRLMMSEPTLPRAGVVILDEFHERHLHSDVALAYLRWLQRGPRPDLKIIVMSATLDTESLAAYLGEAPVFKLDAPVFPVAVEYLPASKEMRLEQQVVRAVQTFQENNSQTGDVLIFLPGMAEIRRCQDALSARGHPGWKILPLHGELPREEQALVFKKFRERKLILSTNVAETSLTIDGVTAVIDGGLHRQADFSWWSGIPALKTKPISQAAAVQRAGRAGRTAPGRVLRLYSASDFQGRPPFETPEIQRADLAQTILELKALPGIDLEKFSWFEPPKPALLTAAVELLAALGALEQNRLGAPLTAVGRRMAELPLHPRLSRILLTGEAKGVLSQAALLAARVGEDELESLDALQGLERAPPETVRRLQAQLLSYFGKAGRGESLKTGANALAFAALTGFPDRVAQRRAVTGLSKAERASAVAREYDLVFSLGGSGTIPAEEFVSAHSLFVVLDVQERQAWGQAKPKVHVRSVCPIEAEWLLDLQPSRLEEKEELIWDEAQKRVVAAVRLQYGQLVLEESRRDAPPSEAAERIFLTRGLGLAWEKIHGPDFHPEAFFQALSPYWDPEVFEAQMARLELWQQFHPDCGLPEPSPAARRAWLLHLFKGVTRAEALRSEIRPENIFEALSAEQRGRLAKFLPLEIQLKGGRKGKIHYQLGKTPWLASRLQDFFGMREGPALLEGKLPLTLHLLAPNQRAVQVTSDLSGFWRQHYPKIRQELKRRYPKHAWPEDPLK